MASEKILVKNILVATLAAVIAPFIYMRYRWRFTLGFPLGCVALFYTLRAVCGLDNPLVAIGVCWFATSCTLFTLALIERRKTGEWFGGDFW